jgi:hypothetical protein
VTRRIASGGRSRGRALRVVQGLAAHGAVGGKRANPFEVTPGPLGFRLCHPKVGFGAPNLFGSGAGHGLAQRRLRRAEARLPLRQVRPGGRLGEDEERVAQTHALPFIHPHAHHPGRHLGRDLQLPHLDGSGPHDPLGPQRPAGHHDERNP